MNETAEQNCLVCGSNIEPVDSIVCCTKCSTHHHEDCWQHVGHCAVTNCKCKDAVDVKTSGIPKWSKVSECVDFVTKTSSKKTLELIMLIVVVCGVQAFVTLNWWLFVAAIATLVGCTFVYFKKSSKYLLDKGSRTIQFYERFFDKRRRFVLYDFDEVECGMYKTREIKVLVKEGFYGIALRTKLGEYISLTNDMRLNAATKCCESLARIICAEGENVQEVALFKHVEAKVITER